MKFNICLNRDSELEPKEFAKLIELIYFTIHESDRGLRDIIVAKSSGRFTELLMDQDFAEMSRRNGDFAMELALYLAKKPAERVNSECSYCGKWGHWDDTCYKLHLELRSSRGRNHN